jgi:hypothetical protein
MKTSKMEADQQEGKLTRILLYRSAGKGRSRGTAKEIIYLNVNSITVSPQIFEKF